MIIWCLSLPECLFDFLLHIFTAQLVSHHDGEFRKIEFSIMIDIDFIHDIHDFILGGITSQGAHQNTQLFSTDEAIAILQKMITDDKQMVKKPKVLY